MSTPIAAVSFDCAETLLEVRWSPAAFALDCARAVGIELDDEPAGSTYLGHLRHGWPDYLRRNQTRDLDLCRRWWMELTERWLRDLNVAEYDLEEIMRASDELLYSPENGYFEAFDDSIPTLQGLRAQGVKLAIASNWDISLFRVLKDWGLADYFEFVAASHVEGFEKPDSRLFHCVSHALDLQPSQILHIGDNPIDDYQGAVGAGFQARLLDRAGDLQGGHVIQSLAEVHDLLGVGA